MGRRGDRWGAKTFMAEDDSLSDSLDVRGVCGGVVSCKAAEKRLDQRTLSWQMYQWGHLQMMRKKEL